jgi:hypothetical protein
VIASRERQDTRIGRKVVIDELPRAEGGDPAFEVLLAGFSADDDR